MLLLGAGCDLPRLTDADAATKSLAFAPGLRLTMQPSYLGVSGTISDVLGLRQGVKEIELKEAVSGSSVALEWATGPAKGSVRAAGMDRAEAMLLPAFWKEGEASVEGNGVLWLSSKAYADLAGGGTTEWRLGLAEPALGTASKLLKTFSAAVSGSATATSPFAVSLKERVGAFPLRIDGEVAHVKALRASSWFADYLILDNPGNPLILKVNVNPLALAALGAFAPLGVDPKGVGYEIVAVRRK